MAVIGAGIMGAASAAAPPRPTDLLGSHTSRRCITWSGRDHVADRGRERFFCAGMDRKESEAPELLDVAGEPASRTAAMATGAPKIAKESLRRSLELPLSEGIEADFESLVGLPEGRAGGA